MNTVMDATAQTIELSTGYMLSQLTRADFQTLVLERTADYFQASCALDVQAGISVEEQTGIDARRTAFGTPPAMYYSIMHGTDVVGWCHLQQSDPDTLTMRNTAIDPAHRRKGLYTALLPIVISHARSEGYQRIVSTHHASNNAVIIPKLKAGFIITGLNINEKYGAMITLTYYVYEGRLRCAQERIGHVPHQ